MRIVSRPDFDGIVCAVLLHEAEPIDAPVQWVQPHAMQKGSVAVQPGDIIANLPYHPRCSLWFDHHYTNRVEHPFQGAFRIAPSAARVVYDHYCGRFKRDFSELVDWTDRIDSADLTLDQVLHPQRYGYVWLSMTLASHDDQDESYWNHLVALLRRDPIDAVLADAQIRHRCQEVVAQNESYRQLLLRHTRMQGHVSITDFRCFGNQAPRGNRFLVYSLFPQASVSVKIRHDHQDSGKVTVSIGHSIFNPDCRVNVGLLLSAYGGGGHRGAGGCTFEAQALERVLPQIIARLLENRSNESSPNAAG
jgi:hypothetical protein